MNSVSLILPIFGVIMVGYLAVRSRLLTHATIDGLDGFVFTFGIPSLLFRSLSKTALPDMLPWGLWLTYYGSMLTAWGIGYLVMRFALQRSTQESVMLGFGFGQGNVVMLGIPIILTAFGEEGGIPLFLLLAFHGLILITSATFLLELTKPHHGTERPHVFAILGQGLKGTARNPIIIGLALGIIWGQTGLTLPQPVDATVEMLSRAAIPCALFVLGGTLSRYQIRTAIGPASVTAAGKLLLHPLLVFLVGRYVFDLEPLWLIVATLLAGMPTGVYSSILANRFGAAPAEVSSAIVLATLTSIVTITGLLQIL